jgi:hypothetical protein
MTPPQGDLFDKYDKALELAAKFEQNFVELGRLLHYLQDHNPNLFKGVFTETALSRRKAYYLARLARQIEKLTIPDQLLIDVGWTKVAVIGLHLTKSNWKDLIKLAKQRTVRELKIIVEGGTPVPGTRCVLLYLKPRQYAIFAKAIVHNGGKENGVGLANKERALMNLIAKAET